MLSASSLPGCENIVTNSPRVHKRYMTTTGVRVVKDGTDYASFVASAVDMSGVSASSGKGSNKVYAAQVLSVPGKTETLFITAYGKVGSTMHITEHWTSEELALRLFRAKLHEKVKVYSVSSNFTKNSAEYTLVKCLEVAPTAPAQAPAPAAESGLVPLPFDPQVSALLNYLYSSASMLKSTKITLAAKSIIIETLPPMVNITEAKAGILDALAYLRTNKITTSSEPGPGEVSTADAVRVLVGTHLNRVLKHLPLPIGKGGHARPGVVVQQTKFWEEHLDNVSLLEQAALAQLSNSMPTPPGAKAGPAPVPAQETGLVEIPGVTVTAGANPALGAIFGGYLRPFPAAVTAEIEAYLAQVASQYPADVGFQRMVTMGLGIVSGNAYDRMIAEHFLSAGYASGYSHQQPDAYSVFAIHPRSNDHKGAAPGQNTALLIHGTSMCAAGLILAGAIDTKFCSGGRLGSKRIYLADDIKKSKQYAPIDSTCPLNMRTSDTKYYFICEVPIPAAADLEIVTRDVSSWSKNEHPGKVVVADGNYGRGPFLEAPDLELFTALFDGKHHPANAPSIVTSAGALSPAAGFFGDGERKIYLPDPASNTRHLRPSTASNSQFDYSEYTFDQNDAVRLRYLLLVHS